MNSKKTSSACASREILSTPSHPSKLRPRVQYRLPVYRVCDLFLFLLSCRRLLKPSNNAFMICLFMKAVKYIKGVDFLWTTVAAEALA